MKKIRIKSFWGPLCNPFVSYTLDLDGSGSVRVDTGIVNLCSREYELVSVSDVNVRRTLKQRIFGLGDVSFCISNGSGNVRLTLANIHNSDYVGGWLCQHKRELRSQSSYISLIQS